MKHKSGRIVLRCLALLLAILLAVPPVYVRAEETEQVTGGVAWTLVDGVLTISPATTPEEGYTSGQMRTDYENNSENGVPWFNDMTTITTLAVESGVANLGNRVCNGASLLTSVSLPSGLTSIGSRCFSDCSSLTSISLPSSISVIGDTAFNGCKSLTEVDLSHTQITVLDKKIFSACPGLTTITLPKITAIGESCFGTSSGIKTSNLKRVNYNGTGSEWSAIVVTTTGSGSGQTYNTQLKNCVIYCTDGLYTVNSSYDAVAYALDGYTAISGYPLAWKIVDNTLYLMGRGATPAFTVTDDISTAPWASSAAAITAVVIDQEITSIGDNTFYDCDTLAYTYTGDFDALKTNSSEVGNEALFGEDESGDDEGGETAPEEKVTGGVKWTLVDGVLTISPATTPESGYTSGQMRTDYENNSQNGVPWFDDMSTITSMIVESGVTNLGNRLCNGASGLISVSLPSGLTSVGDRCFSDCESLTSINLPDSVTSLGATVFNGCFGLTEVDISNTAITALGTKVFAACKNLTTLKIPGTVKTIASNTFGSTKYDGTAQYPPLKTLYYGGSLDSWKSIENITSDENKYLYDGSCTVYCSDGIWNAKYTSAGGNLLYKLDNGTLTILCNGEMPDYQEGAAPWFAQAAEITAVVFEDGTTSVGANAFDGCVNLTDVTICEGVTKVGENAFVDCTQLANVQFYGTSTQWTALQNASGTGNDPLFDVTITNGYSGKCGDNARWEYDQATKTLTISGTGPMWDWNQRTYENTPWSKFKDEIETIKIGYGITNTGRYAFCYMSALKNLEFLTNEDGFTTVETIGGYCFCWYNQLTTLTLPEGVRFIAGRAFSRCESVATLYLPSTLESIDMYAFQSNDSSVIINKVYYNGTKEDWERKVYVSTQGDGRDQLYSQNTEWVYLKDYTYYTDVADDAWYKDAVYYLKDQGMAPEGTSFGVEAAAAMDWVLDALYIRAGSSGAYVDALDWAKIQTIVAADTTADVGVSLNALADILYRTSLYNGHLADLGEETALAWCQAQGYISEQLDGQAADAALNRAQAASVLAAYLQSSNGSANRYDKMRDEMKAAYETGGDGKMHILALHHAGTGKFGDCTLILMPGGELMLIDTFRNDGWKNYLKATLDSLGVKKLDYLVLSHGHEDHDANLDDVINYIYDNGYTIGNYWSASSTTSTREKAAVALLQEKGDVNIQNRLRAGAQLTIGSGSNTVMVDVLWPMDVDGKGYNGSETNDGSLTMKLTYGDSSYLCGGDLFLTAEADVLELHKDNLDILKADVMKTNHHGSYSSNGSDWVAAVDPMAMITYSDDSGDSSQCYEYSRDGRAWFSAGRDGGILVVMDNKENITVTTGYDTNLRQNIYACGENGHSYDGQAWEFDEIGHWRKCEGFWLCGAMEPVVDHAGGTANCQYGKICETCGFEYTEKGTHNWVYSAEDNVITATCGTCRTSGGTLTLEIADTAPVYDGTAKTVAVSGSINGVITPDVVYEGSRVNAGTFTASIELGNARAELDVTVGKRNVTITAKDQTIAYGSSISNTEITASGLVEGHSVSATLTPSTSDVTANGTITPGAAVITADGVNVTANYNITYVTGKLVIQAATTEAEQKAEAVTQTIANLPATVEPDDEETAEKILAAKAAYDVLTEAEKSLVSNAAKKKLDDLLTALTAYDIIEGDGGKWTENSSGSLSFTANGPFSKFTGIKVDGREVSENDYTAKSGSTIITLEQSYLKKLSAGEHTITVLYTDGETSGTFTVKPEAVSPETGENTAILLWSAILLGSMLCLTLLSVNYRKFAYRGKSSMR